MTDSNSEENTEEAAATEENSSDRSSHGSSGGAGGGYSADYSGSASDGDEGPSSGSGSDDNNNNNNKQSSTCVGTGGLSTLQIMANALPAANADNCSAADNNQGKKKDGPNASERGPSPLHLLRRRKRSAEGTTSHHEKPAPRSKADSGETESSSTGAALPKFHARSARPKANTSSAFSSTSSSSSGSLDGEPLVRRPMDPRIDLSVVHTADSLKGIIQEANRGNLYDSNNFPSHRVAGHMRTSTNDSYQRLMEAVRPFFHSSGIPMSAMQQELHRSASEALSEGFTSFFATTDSTVNKSAKEEEEEDNESMAVLARTQRKHRRAAGEETNGSNNETCCSCATSGEKRVRIQEAQQQQQQHQEKNVALAIEQQRQHPEAMKHPPRMVTDVSGSSTGQNNSSAGSGGNSNVGTSSSGNDGGGKSGSSEEIGAKDEEEDGTNDNSEANASNNEKPKATAGITTSSSPRQAAAALEAHNHPAGSQLLPHTGAERERKLQDKKRKRIEMRREYEAQQQFDSSEASAAAQEQYFRPGKPVTLDNVLVLSKIPRIIVQGTPPFLVVHTNAAYCRLTGIDSHTIVGKPVKALLSIDKNDKITQPSDEQPPERGGDDSTSVQQRNRTTKKPSEDVTLEQLIATSGFGHSHNVQAHRKLLHQMVGKNVTVFNNNNGSEPPAGTSRRDGEESNKTSLSSSSDDGQERQPFPCRISIAPIVSPMTAINNSALVVDREAEVPFQKGKRAKHHHGATEQQATGILANHHRKAFQPLQMVTHFVIQLQPQGAEANEGSMESLSSNSASVEARLLGLSQEQVKRQRDAVNVAAPQREAEEETVEEESTTETSSTKEPVATIG